MTELPKMPTRNEDFYESMASEEALAENITASVCWWMNETYRKSYGEAIRACLKRYRKPKGFALRLMNTDVMVKKSTAKKQ